MTKEDYLNTKEIQLFIDWILPKISVHNGFCHSYTNRRNNKKWHCNNIYNAYENYEWAFSSYLPIKNEKIKGKNFEVSAGFLNEIKKGMLSSIKKNDHSTLIKYSNSLLKWGGVTQRNSQKIKDLGSTIVPYYQFIEEKLNPENVDLNDDFNGINMNSGFTKIYAVLIPDFVIYDSRVGAALGLLVKKFLEESNNEKIPESLNFSYGRARSTKNDYNSHNLRNSRDPSSDKFVFTCLNNNPIRHIKNNIQANWLLKEIAMRSKFRNTPTPLRALEAALFMIGYDVRNGI
jgi:hypothetical protein